MEMEIKSKKEVVDPFGVDRFVQAERRGQVGVGSSTMYIATGKGVAAPVVKKCLDCLDR